MRLFRTAICAALIAAAPLAAEARLTSYRGAHHHAGRHRSSGRSPRGLRDPSLRADAPDASCAVDLADSLGRPRRCTAARAAFERTNPCPSTGQPRGPCPGYVVDHIVPLKRGGLDDPSNMQWQTIADAQAKDKRE